MAHEGMYGIFPNDQFFSVVNIVLKNQYIECPLLRTMWSFSKIFDIVFCSFVWNIYFFNHHFHIMFLVKGLKVVAKHYLSWHYFYDDIYKCIGYSNVEYQVDIFNTQQQNGAQKQMVELAFGLRFDDLNRFQSWKFIILFHYILKDVIAIFCRTPSI